MRSRYTAKASADENKENEGSSYQRGQQRKGAETTGQAEKEDCDKRMTRQAK